MDGQKDGRLTTGEEGGRERRANFPRNHHQHHHLTYPSSSFSPSLSLSRLVNELVIDSMNWNPNLSLSFILFLFRHFIDLFWRRIRILSTLWAMWTPWFRVSLVTYFRAAFPSFPFHSMSKKSKWLYARPTDKMVLSGDKEERGRRVLFLFSATDAAGQ